MSENVKTDDKALMNNLKSFNSDWKNFNIKKPEIGLISKELWIFNVYSGNKKDTGNKEKGCHIKVKKYEFLFKNFNFFWFF